MTLLGHIPSSGLKTAPPRADSRIIASARLWDSALPNGGGLRLLVSIAYVAFGAAAFLLDVKEGFYAAKIPLLLLASVLVFYPRQYPFLLGLLLPTYFELKGAPGSKPETALVLSFSHSLMLFMLFGNWLFGGSISDKRPAPKVDAGLVLLLSLLAVSGAGVFFVENTYLFARRIVEMAGFLAAYVLGRYYADRVGSSLKLMLLGLAIGMIAFTLPWTVGLILRDGLDALKQLDRLRAESIGAAQVAIEAGIVTMVFALGTAMAGAPISSRWRQFSIWFVALPAAVANLIYISRAGILLMPLVVTVSAILSKRKTGGISALAAFGSMAVAVYLYAPGWFVSFGERMGRLTAGIKGRSSIRSAAWQIGFDNPAFGVGAGQFRFHSGGIWHAHNDSLTLFAEQGIIGVTLYLAFWLFLLYTTLRLVRLGGDFRTYGFIFWVVCLAYLGYSQIEPLYFNRAGLMFAFLGGLTVALAATTKRLRSPS